MIDEARLLGWLYAQRLRASTGPRGVAVADAARRHADAVSGAFECDTRSSSCAFLASTETAPTLRGTSASAKPRSR